jgi:hypothetical protein
MKSVEELRRINLDKLIQETPDKTIERVAEIAGCNATYLRQVKNQHIVSSNGKPATMGKLVARRLESGFGKFKGWMDIDHDSPALESELSLIQMMDLKLSAGTGNIVFEIDGSRKIAFRSDYLKKRGIRPENAFGFHVDGDSMADVGIHDGGMVAVNSAIKEPKPNKFYGMWIDDKYMVKEVVKRPDGYYAVSHNAEKKHKYPDRLIDSENSGIIGQVFWCGFEL